ncbi:MAG: heavy metal translocating P-type ATPase [Nitrospirota bacterium]
MDKLHLKIGGLHCSFCVDSIQRAYRRTEGVSDVKVSLAHEEILISYDSSKITVGQIKDTLRALGFTIRDPKKVKTFEEEEAEVRQAKRRLLIAGGLAALAAGLMFLMWFGYTPSWTKWTFMILALLTVLGPGGYIIKMAYQSLRRGILNQHVLMEFAALAGLIGGVIGFLTPSFPAMDFFGVTVFVTTYHILSGYTSLFIRTRSSQAVRKLLTLQPQIARVIRNGKEIEVTIEEVEKGELVRIRPGEQIPVDGIVVEGLSAVNESLVTGESVPVEKMPGAEVIGGSINQSGTLVVRVTSVGEESFLQRIARHIEEARALKPGIIQLVEKVLKYFIPAVLGFAAFGFLLWTVGLLITTGQVNLTRGVFAMLAVLVMGYPCALGMATPLALIRGGGMAAQKGILIRSGEAFQALKNIDKVVLDKTGTITKGKPEVVDVIPDGEAKRNELLMIAAEVEKASEHPLATAIVEFAEKEGVTLNKVDQFLSVPGKGVQAVLDSHVVRAGNMRFLEEADIAIAGGLESSRKLEDDGKTVVAVAKNRELMGLIAIADTLKDDAVEAIRRMKEKGLETIMMTGDNWRTAQAVAAKVGIQEVMAEVLPDKKTEQVRELQSKGYRVAMIGDGINDAPALMQADVGIAIGAGTDIAIESADVILIGERLAAIVDAYDIARKSYNKTVQNLIIAFTFNGIGVPLATTGLVHPVWAMIAMAASVSSVLLNSFGGRLLEKAKIEEAGRRKEVFLSVPNIHCEGCIRTIRDALEKNLGPLKVEADLERHLIKVVFSDGGFPEKRIKKTVEKAGFPAKIVKNVYFSI